MTFHMQTDIAYITLLKQIDTTHVVLLHPDSRYRSIFVARLLNDSEVTTFYYALGPDDVDLNAFILGITHDVANQHSLFGRHLNLMPGKVYANPSEHLDFIVETFVTELSEMHDSLFVLILDEYDRSDTADDIQRFLEKLIGSLPSHCRLVINSRTIPRIPWLSIIAQSRATIFRDGEIIRHHFYRAPISESRLEVYALGPGYVLYRGQLIDNWEGHLPRLLFFFTLDRPMVTRSEICYAFWPELDPDQAVNVFHVTKRRLHKALDADVLIHENGYYQINPELNVYYDASEFTSLLMNGRDPENETPYETWQRAAQLYRGPFLQGHEEQWVIDRRQDFRAGYLEAMIHLAQRWLDENQNEQALILYQRALKADYTYEELHRRVMGLYMMLGRRSEAVIHYRRLEAYLKKRKQTPEETTAQLYEDILKES